MLVAAAWWPIGTYWLSDDWIVAQHASELGRALGDFGRNHCDLRGAVWFYRPLVSLGFGIEALLGGGPDPQISHASNAIALGLTAALLGAIVARFSGPFVGFFAGLCWAGSAVHAGVVHWVCGRTAAFSEPWILLAVWWTIRWIDGARWARAAALGAFALGLLTKELAVVTPGLVALMACAAAAPSSRLRTATRAALPFAIVLLGYLGLRYVVLGRWLGGYAADELGLGQALLGLASWTGQLAAPATLVSDAGVAELGIDPSVVRTWAWASAAPAAVGAALWWRRGGPRALAMLVALYACCVAPSLQFWGQPGAHNLRLFSLPLAPVAALAAGGGLWTGLPALALATLPWLEARRDYGDEFAASRRTHELLLQETADLPPGPVFVSGLPRRNRDGSIVLFQLGVDRLLAPPFGDGRHRVFALRPLSGRGDAPRLEYGDARGLPLGTTLALLREGTGLGRLPPPTVRRVDASLQAARPLDAAALTSMHAGAEAPPTFAIAAPRASHYRITAFTAGGYVSAILPNEAEPGHDGGRVAVYSWLVAGTTARAAVTTDLVVPAAIDLDLRMPVLVEAGDVRDVAGQALFAARAVARDWVWLELGDDYARFIGDAR